MTAHPSLQVYRQELTEFINPGFELITLASDCAFTEGPVWDPGGFYLFSDITANCIYRINPQDSREQGRKQVWLEDSGTSDPGDPDLKPDQVGSNGLGFNTAGDLLICRHGSHSIARFRKGEMESYIGSYQGRPFNSPNDLIVHGSGAVYFSDPPYGLRDGRLRPEKFQPLAGVYRYYQGETILVCDRYQYPNGVCLSPDQELLYICSSKPFEAFVSVYETATNEFKKILAEENSDGIETDRYGNIYLCSREGIVMLNSKGERMGLIALPEIPANACWGGADGEDLLITARRYVFLARGLQRQSRRFL